MLSQLPTATVDPDSKVVLEITPRIWFTLEIAWSKNKNVNWEVLNISSPEQIAYDFALEYNLNYVSHKNLLKTIKSAINTYKNNKRSPRNSMPGVVQAHWSSLKRSKSSQNKIKRDYTIYERGIWFRNETEKKWRTLQQELDDSEDELWTFQPKINKITASAEEYRRVNDKHYNSPNIIANYKKYYDEKLRKLRKKYSITSTNAHDFLGDKRKKQKFYNNHTEQNSTKRYEKCYHEYINKIRACDTESNTSRSKFNDNIYTFHPWINNPLLKNHNKYLHSHYSEPFIRLYNYAEKYNRKIRKHNEKERFDVTNQINYTTEKSNTIFNMHKEERFRKIFLLLDKNEDGQISKLHCDTKFINKDLLRVLLPIWHSLSDDNKSIKENDFIYACFRWYDTLGYNERKVLWGDSSGDKKIRAKSVNKVIGKSTVSRVLPTESSERTLKHNLWNTNTNNTTINNPKNNISSSNISNKNSNKRNFEYYKDYINIVEKRKIMMISVSDSFNTMYRNSGVNCNISRNLLTNNNKNSTTISSNSNIIYDMKSWSFRKFCK